MIKKLFVLFLAVLLLTGCQLAEPETEAEGYDRLVGVFVTREHLNLFDMESYLQDNAGKLVNGGALLVEDSFQYNRRIYAELVEREWKDEEGISHSYETFEFAGLEGELLSTCWIEDGAEGYWANDARDWFSEVHSGLNSGDNGSTGLEMEATIYVSPAMDEILFFYNPVYQTPEGEVYLVEGQGSSCQFFPGSSMAHTLSDEKTTTVEGAQRRDWTDIRVEVECIHTAERIVLNFANEKNEVFFREEYDGADIPAEVTAPEGTAYVICEVYHLDETGEETMFRQITDPDGEAIEVYREVEDGICRKSVLEIIWPEER